MALGAALVGSAAAIGSPPRTHLANTKAALGQLERVIGDVEPTLDAWSSGASRPSKSECRRIALRLMDASNLLGMAYSNILARGAGPTERRRFKELRDRYHELLIDWRDFC